MSQPMRGFVCTLVIAMLNKSDAVRRIIRITDAETFLRESGYAGGSQ